LVFGYIYKVQKEVQIAQNVKNNSNFENGEVQFGGLSYNNDKNFNKCSLEKTYMVCPGTASVFIGD